LDFIIFYNILYPALGVWSGMAEINPDKKPTGWYDHGPVKPHDPMGRSWAFLSKKNSE